MPRPRDPENTEVPPELATAPQAAGDTTAAAPDRERIATRAYDLYLAHDRSDGEAMADWLEAERECSSEESDRMPE